MKKLTRASDIVTKVATTLALLCVSSTANCWAASSKNQRVPDPTLEKSCTQLSEHTYEISYYSDTNSLKYESCQVDGVPDGETRNYYENGQLRSAGFYKNGKPTGPWTRWYTTGKKQDEGNWDEGRPMGVWHSYYNDGRPKEVFHFASQGEKCLEQSFAPDGTQLKVSPCQSEKRNTSFARFNLNVLSLFEDSSGQYTTGELSWNPEIPLNNRLSLQGLVGAFILYSQSSQSHFLGAEVGPLLSLKLNSALSVEVGPGFQLWLDTNTNSSFELLAQLSYSVSANKWIHRFFIGVSDVTGMPNGNTTGPLKSTVFELKAGLGF